EIQTTTGVGVGSWVARVIRNETARGGTPARSAPGVVAAHEAPPSWENATKTCVPCGPDVFRSTRPQVAKPAGRNGSVTSTAEGAKCSKSIEMSCRTGAAGLGVKRRARYWMYDPAGDTTGAPGDEDGGDQRLHAGSIDGARPLRVWALIAVPAGSAA